MLYLTICVVKKEAIKEKQARFRCYKNNKYYERKLITMHIIMHAYLGPPISNMFLLPCIIIIMEGIHLSSVTAWNLL